MENDSDMYFVYSHEMIFQCWVCTFKVQCRQNYNNKVLEARNAVEEHELKNPSHLCIVWATWETNMIAITVNLLL